MITLPDGTVIALSDWIDDRVYETIELGDGGGSDLARLLGLDPDTDPDAVDQILDVLLGEPVPP